VPVPLERMSKDSLVLVSKGSLGLTQKHYAASREYG